MYRNFKAVSLSHKSASVEIRERVALNEEECRRLLSYFKEFMDFQDVLVLSTCNRTEVYYSSSTERSSEIVKLIGLQKGLDMIRRGDRFFHQAFFIKGKITQGINHPAVPKQGFNEFFGLPVRVKIRLGRFIRNMKIRLLQAVSFLKMPFERRIKA